MQPVKILLLLLATAVFLALGYDDNEDRYSYHRQRRGGPNRDICENTVRHAERFGSWMTFTNSTLVIPFIRPAFEKLPKMSLAQFWRSDRSGILAGSQDCVSQLSLKPEDKPSLMTRSICPWFWRLNFDPKRIPHSIPEAVCRCKMAVTDRTDAVYECHEHKMEVRVLKFDQSCETYTEAVEHLSFACVAAHQIAKLVSKGPGVEIVRNDDIAAVF